MYTDFYGLAELPFELSPNPKYLLLTARHREALANLQYGISARKSLTLLLGEAGTGKTTLVKAALQSEACRSARILHLANPMLTRDEFVEFLARGFDLSPEAARSKTSLLFELSRVLQERRDRGITTALVVDEAQVLPEELLEEIRLLANMETSSEKLLPVVLAGQPELADRLNQPSLRQLKQRVALRCKLGLLDLVETTAYVAGRLRIAGASDTKIFSREAINVVHLRSSGVPRTISVICDNALVSGFAAGERVIGPDIVREVCDDFDLGPTKARLSPGAALLPRPKPAAAAVRPEPQTRPGARSPEPGPDEDRVASAPAEDLFASFGRKKRFSFF